MSSKQKNQNIQVFVRARPLNAAEKSRGSFSVMETSDHTVTLKERPQDKITKSFTFDRVFGPKSKQVDVYRKVVMPLLEQVLLGYNCTVFAYGQTGTGKTFTMEGERCEAELPWDQDPGLGIIPRTLSQLFDELRIQGVEFTVRVSFLELYNEELFDLLSPETDTTRLRLYEDAAKKGSCIIHGLEEVTVHNKNDVYEILRLGSQKRQTAATLMNAHSSRSHTVFSVTVHIKENSVDGEELLKTGKLNLVDLAGSENVGRSGAVDRRAREAGNINQSLLTLGRVITSLVERAPHVPYRESKLTRLLQDSLGGRTKTSIIAAVSPASCNIEETLSTLDYAQRAKSITNRPEINQRLSKKTLMKEYTEEIERLRRDLLATREQTGVYLAPENYQSMLGQMEEQGKEIVEKVNHIRALQEQMEAKEVLFNSLKTTLEETEVKLSDTRGDLQRTQCDLQTTRETLQETETALDEQTHLVERRTDTERRLAGQASQLLTAVKGASVDLHRVHDRLERSRTAEQHNETLTRQFGAQFGTEMGRLEEAVAAAGRGQRAFCAAMEEGLAADAERRRAEVAALGEMLSALLGAQTGQMAELGSALQTEAGERQRWTETQRAAAADRRRWQAETEGELRRGLSEAAGALLTRLTELDAAAERRRAELHGWLTQHEARMGDTLGELRRLIREWGEHARRETEQRAADIEAERLRQAESRARQVAQIESLKAALSQLSADTERDAAAAASALADQGAALQRSGAEQTRFVAAAGAQLESARGTVAEDTVTLNKIYAERDAEVSRATAEARAGLDAAQASWTTSLDQLSAGAEEHLALLQAALAAGAEADTACLADAQARLDKLTDDTNRAVEGVRGRLTEGGQDDYEGTRRREAAAAQQGESVDRETGELTGAVRERAAEVQSLLSEGLSHVAATGLTPQRRDFSYPRYLAATSPHERLLQRYRAQRAAQRGADQLPLPPLDADELRELANPGQEATPDREAATPADQATPAVEAGPSAAETAGAGDASPEAESAPETPSGGPLSAAPSVSDLSDAGSDVENRRPQRSTRQKERGEFAVPAARRQTRRALRQPKVNVTRQASQSPRRPAPLGSRND